MDAGESAKKNSSLPANHRPPFGVSLSIAEIFRLKVWSVGGGGRAGRV